MTDQSTCAGIGNVPCVAPREFDRQMCLAFVEEDRGLPEAVSAWSLALDLHDGNAQARANIAARFDVLGGYLMLRGGTDFLNACRAAVADGRWGALVHCIADLERSLLRDKYLRRNGDRVERAKGGDYRIPTNIDQGGPLFPAGTP